jgi:hypothetical protein
MQPISNKRKKEQGTDIPVSMSSIYKIAGINEKYVGDIQSWQGK